MSLRKVVSLVVGVFQEVVGIGSLVFTHFYYYNIFNFHDLLDLSPENTPVFIFLLIVFSLLSIISGGLLIQEWRTTR